MLSPNDFLNAQIVHKHWAQNVSIFLHIIYTLISISSEQGNSLIFTTGSLLEFSYSKNVITNNENGLQFCIEYKFLP